MNIKEFPDWDRIYQSCGFACCELSLLIRWLEEMIDWCTENGQEFPLYYDEFKCDLENTIKLISEFNRNTKEE